MISKIHISPPEIKIQKEVGKAIGTAVFKKDQVVSAKVLTLLTPGKASLLINGQKVIAKTGLLLNPGEELKLRVANEKDLTLVKLQDPSKPLGVKQLVAMVRSLSKNNALADIARTKIPVLKDILQETALKSAKRDDSFLPRLIENSGLTLEKKMGSIVKMQGQQTLDLNLAQLGKQDFKGAILNQLAQAVSGGEGLEKTLTAVLDTLESFQLLNTQTSESGRYLLPFPVFEGSNLSFGQLLIDTGDKKEDKNKDNPKVMRISFLLSMTNLGAVRADFSILKKAITGRFLLETDGVCQYMKTMIPELKLRFEQLEYTMGSIDCLTAAKADVHSNVLMESLFENGDDSVLNIVI
jgi:hypothetical protein